MFLEDIYLRLDSDPFCISWQISSMNKKTRSENSLNPKAPFKCFLMDIIASTAPKFLTSDTTFSSSLIIVDIYSKITNIYGIEKITTEGVMDNLDMLQSRFGKIDEFEW